MINKERLNNLASELWKGAIKLRGKFKAYEYQAVILPMVMIRRIECMLLQKREELEAEIKKNNSSISDSDLKKKVKQREILTVPFHNKSEWTLKSIQNEDSTQVETNFREYLKEFSPLINEIIDEFNYRETVTKMVKANRLESIISLVADEDFSTARLSNIEMGYVYEELLQRFTQDDAKDTGEHFTPREIIRIMVELLDIDFDPNKSTQSISIYDPACGTGGMLSIAKEHLLDKATTPSELAKAQEFVMLFGQELLPQNYAVCKTDLLLRGDIDGNNHNNITHGNSLIPEIESSKERGDLHYGRQFDYMISNPPFGVNWDEYASDVLKFKTTRYKAGLPPSNDGALLFLLSMIEKMKPVNKGGSRISILFNGSPLSNGDCGGGESEIRRFILENDYLEAVVMLPDQMFYQTGIYTYIWVLSNKKPKERRDQILFINARQQFEKEPKAFGNKRNRITDQHRTWIKEQFNNWQPNEFCKLFKTHDFAYRKAKVVFWQTDENDNPMWISEAFSNQLNNSNVKKKFDLFGDFEMSVNITSQNKELYHAKININGESTFETCLKKELIKNNKSLKSLDAREFSIWLKNCEISVSYFHRHYIEDAEYIPYEEEIESYLNREIAKPIINWQSNSQLGYEFLPNKYFFSYSPPASSDVLLLEFWALEKEAEAILLSIKKASK
ncbi:MAG: N-6 DNA methylase [Bacteroidota bacterium]